MIVKNPVDSEISIQYKGTVYTVPANGEKSGIPAEVAIFWQSKIHNFITIADEEVVAKAPVVESKPVEVKEPEAPVVVAEEPKVAVAPKAVKAK